jgi:phosphotransferase system enzyme I (PtsI)
MVLGFATEVGSKISHTAIMARSLNIPAVVGLHEFLGEVTAGDDVLLDGYGGLVIINPTEATLYQYGEFQSSRRAFQDRLTVICAEPTQTLDGQSFLLGANIE